MRRADSLEKTLKLRKIEGGRRKKKETLEKTSPTFAEDYKECRANEKELLNNSLEGFMKARAEGANRG